MNPLVTVLIDTYNHERYIEQALVSVLEQDFPASDMEILVVDDGSTDRTPEIVRKFAPRIRLLRKKNGGQASAFNLGLAESRGEIISFLDGDDWFAQGKLTAVMNALEEYPEVAAVGHGHYIFHETTKEVVPRCPTAAVHLHLGNTEAALQARLAGSFALPGALTVRKATVLKAIPIPADLTFCADAPITAVAMLDGIYILTQPLFYYRRHPNNLFAGRSDAAQVQRRYMMSDRAYREMERTLARLGAASESIVALIYNPWTQTSRFRLRNFGGSPLDTFRTEMRFFRLQYPHPTTLQLAYKYIIGGAATLSLPPRTFYRLQNWAARPALNRLRKTLFKTNGKPA